MAPAAMMAPWPIMRRGLEDMVPTVPGLVREMVVPWKSAGGGLARGGRGTRAAEGGGGEFGAAGAGHKVVESGDVFLETERAGVLDVGHHEAARAVLARDVDGDAEVHLGPHQTEGLAVALGVGVVESGDFFQGFDDGPADEVGVGNFAAADEGAVLIDDAPVFIHHLDGDGAL